MIESRLCQVHRDANDQEGLISQKQPSDARSAAQASGTLERVSSSVGVAVADAVNGLVRRVHGPVRDTHHVASPLGVWLVLALAVPAMLAEQRARAESLLGMSAEQAAGAAAAMLAEYPEAVRAAVAVWRRRERTTPALETWLAGLPAQVQTGDVPTQALADDWIAERTGGLISAFPVELTQDSALVLAAALASNVNWFHPLDTEPGSALGPVSAWSRQLGQVLSTSRAVSIVATEHAGDVAVVVNPAEGLAVVSVLAGPDVDCLTVLEAAHALAGAAARGKLAGRSLFDLPLGEGPLGVITEESAQTPQGGDDELQIAVLPAWSASSKHDLTAPGGALADFADTLAHLLAPDALGYLGRASQSVRAEYTRLGFVAASGLAWDTMLFGLPPSTSQGRLRTAVLRYGHPHAVVAVAVGPAAVRQRGTWHGLPVYSAWITDPDEA